MNICVISAGSTAYSETFIKAHIEHLKAKHFALESLPVLLDVYYPGAPASAADKARSAFRKLREGFKLNRFVKYLKSNSIDVVLAEYGQSGAKAMNGCIKAGVPLVVHFHGFDAYIEDVIQQFGAKYKELFAYASGIIAVSQAMKQKLIGLGCPENKISVIPCGVSFAPGPEKPAYNSRQVFAAGRFVEKKAPYLTLLAFNKALKHAPGSKLVMAGSGPLLPVVKNMVKSLKLEDSVSLPGSQPHAAIQKYMMESAVFVQHSIIADNGDSEGLPVGVMEAMMLGMPVVSTYHAGIPDVIKSGETGFLCKEGDIDTMADFMTDLLLNPDKGREAGCKASEFAAANLTQDIAIGKLRAVLQKAAGKS
ncbi:MAG: glycosyltransferase [Bacteroidota bacterium]